MKLFFRSLKATFFHSRENLFQKNFYTKQKMKFSIKDFFSKCDQIRGFGRIYLEILNEKLHFLCSVIRVMLFSLEEITYDAY